MKKYEYAAAECKSPEDLIRLLLDHGEVYNHAGELLYSYQSGDGFSIHLEGESSAMPMLGFKAFKDVWIKKEIKWYERLPITGRLCWVGTSLITQTIARVTEYNELSADSFICDNGSTYAYANPLTNDEIKGFLETEDGQNIK